MVVPPWYELPPPGYGGLEQVTAALVDGLVARGHHVTLFGAGTQTGTAARFVSTVERPQHERLNESLPEMLHVARVHRMLEESVFDVVHDHTGIGPLTAPTRTVPTVVTVHNNPAGEVGDYLACLSRDVALVAISHSQRRLRPDLRWTATVHHGLPAAPTTRRPAGVDGPALWLARFNPDKGPDLAIEACRKAGVPLVLAGKCTEPGERRYFDQVIVPMLGPDVEVVLNADRRRVAELLGRARCLLMPIRWHEPFGMVLLEAMAVGTPVVALNRGAVPEVIDPGVTGLICSDVDELPDALHEVLAIDPAACVAHVRTAFSADLMARRYEQVYLACRRRSLAARTLERLDAAPALQAVTAGPLAAGPAVR